MQATYALRTLFLDATRLYRRYPFVAAMTWLPWAALVLVQAPRDRIGVGLIGAVVTLVGQAMLSIYERSLKSRMTASSDRSWTVEVFGTELGVVTDAEYAAMRLRAAFSIANYLRQLLNACEMALNLLRWFSGALPFLLFWMAVGGLLIDPAGAVAIAQKIWFLAQSYPSILARGVAEWLAISMCATGMVCGVFFPRILGFGNQFRADWEHALRRRLNLPAGERPTLYYLEGNHRRPADESARFRMFLRAHLGGQEADAAAAVGDAR